MQYTLKVLIDLDARDDVLARQMTAALVTLHLSQLPGVREIVLHSQADHKSIRVKPDGTFDGNWNKGAAR